MNDLSKIEDRYLDPPDDAPVCENCEEVLHHSKDGGWVCVYIFCPSRFQGVELNMAIELMESKQKIDYLREKIRRLERRIPANDK